MTGIFDWGYFLLVWSSLLVIQWKLYAKRLFLRIANG
jgi:hypothetical protein